MKLIHEFEEMTPEKRPQDPHMDGTGLTFTTSEHGGEYPDTMPQAIVLTDAEGRSCTYLPVTVAGRVVDSNGLRPRAGRGHGESFGRPPARGGGGPSRLAHPTQARFGGRSIENASGAIPASISRQVTGAATGKPGRTRGE